MVEHFPDVVLRTIQRSPETYEWFGNEWVHLVVIDPETRALSVFKDGEFRDYRPLKDHLDRVADLKSVLETHEENLPVFALS